MYSTDRVMWSTSIALMIETFIRTRVLEPKRHRPRSTYRQGPYYHLPMHNCHVQIYDPLVNYLDLNQIRFLFENLCMLPVGNNILSKYHFNTSY